MRPEELATETPAVSAASTQPRAARVGHHHGPPAVSDHDVLRKASMNHHQKIPRVARISRGRTRRHRADEYEAYNYEAGSGRSSKRRLASRPCARPCGRDGVHHNLILGEHRAMSRFTGGEPTRIHHLERILNS